MFQSPILLWGLQGSSDFCKCWLVLVLYSASSLRALTCHLLSLFMLHGPWIFMNLHDSSWIFMNLHESSWPMKLDEWFWLVLQVHLDLSPGRNQFSWTPGTAGAPHDARVAIWSQWAWFRVPCRSCRPTSPTVLPGASWQSLSGSNNRRWVQMSCEYFDVQWFSIHFMMRCERLSLLMCSSGEWCHAAACFQECAFPGCIWLGLAKRLGWP